MTTKLSPYFVLNSISNQSELRGVTEHPENGCVIVTFNRNMVSRYKITEQRPLGSWTSREALYGAAVYDTESSRYAVLLSKTELRLWNEEDSKLSKVKKYMFTSHIWGLVSGPKNEVCVVFENGNVKPLSDAVESRKEKAEAKICEDDSIIHCCVVSIKACTYVVTVTCKQAQQSHTTYLQEVKEDKTETTKKFTMPAHPKAQLSGKTVKCADGELALITLWSNGDLYSLPLLKEVGWDSDWGFSLGKIDGIRTNKKVCLTSLSSKHLAVYGADPSEEGATLLLYNTQFRVVQASQKLKMYSSPPLMYGPFGNQLVVASGHHLLVTRFHLGHETVASMLRSANKRKTAGTDTQMQRLSWGSKAAVQPMEVDIFSTAPESIRESLRNMGQKGLSESEIMLKVSPVLVEKRDVLALSWCLQHFREVPESVLARLASFCLREQETTFAALAPAKSLPTQEDDSSASLPPESPLGGGRRVLLDTTLNVAFNVSRLLPQLKHHLAPQDAILLLRHISARLWHGDEPSDQTEAQVTQLLSWCCSLLDANYQHCLLSQDSQVLRTLTALSDIVDTQIGQIEELRALEPILLRMQQGRKLPQSKDEDRIYSIETVYLL